MNKEIKIIACALAAALGTCVAEAADKKTASRPAANVTRQLPKGWKEWKDPQTGVVWFYSLNQQNEAILNATEEGTGARDLVGDLTPPSCVDGIPVTEFGISAFCKFRKITSVTVSASVKNIGHKNCRNPFRYCEALKAIRVDETNPFYSSDGVALYDKNKKMLFSVPAGLASFKVPDGVNVIFAVACGHTGSGKNKNLRSVTIPASVREIDAWAFCGCSALQEINLPSTGLERIGFAAFGGHEKLESFVIPATVTNLENVCIGACPNLKSLKFLSKTPPPMRAAKFNETFARLHPDCTAWIPADATGDWSVLEKLGLKIKRY